MGGFLLLKNNSFEPNSLKESLQIFKKKNLELNQTILTEQFTLYTYFKKSHKKQNVYKPDENNIISAAGTLIYKNKINNLKELLKDFKENDCKVDFSKFSGHFCVIIILNDKLYIFNDFGGIYHIYTNSSSMTIFSSSFIVIQNLINPRTLSKQELYEYIFYGATYGNKTIFSEIELLDCKNIWEISDKVKPIKKNFNLKPDLTSCKFSTILDSVSENLLYYFKMLKRNFNNNIIFGLSGGFDSRLILASSMACKICPKIYVSGSDNSLDVKISKLIAEKENLQFEHFNQNNAKRLDKFEYLQFIKNRFFNVDGFSYAGLFSSTINMDITNSEKAMLNINGGGGEIYRNFWTLPNKSVTINSFIKSKYDSIDFRMCKDEFNKSEFFNCFKEKIKLVIENNIEKINGKQITKLYPYWRLRYWNSKAISILNQYSYSLLPFAEPILSLQSFEIPIKYKTAGRFEAALIKNINPKISQYQSIYGQSFNENISLKNKINDLAKIHTPIILRPLLRKSLKKGTAEFPYFLSRDYLEQIFNFSKLTINNYVDINKITDTQMFSRALTIEYLIAQN